MGIGVSDSGKAERRRWTAAAALVVLSSGCFLDPPTKPGGAPGFTVDTEIVGISPPALRSAVEKGVQRLQEIITGDLPDASVVGFFSSIACGVRNGPTIDRTVDDVLLLISIGPIDGYGGAVAQAGPCALRDYLYTGLPSIGVITMDSDDFGDLMVLGQLDDAMLHQMLHALGVGTLWGPTYFDLLIPTSQTSAGFAGTQAMAGCLQIAAPTAMCQPIPVDPGATWHWSEEAFGTEMMTTFAPEGGGRTPLSVMSINSLADIGYTVNTSKADAFTWSEPVLSASRPPVKDRIQRASVIVGPNGSIRPIR